MVKGLAVGPRFELSYVTDQSAMLQAFQDWFFGLGAEYGVNPLVFGLIYVGTIPFFTASVAWLVRNLRRGRPIVLPAMCGSFCFVSAYLYLAVAGRNIPSWVWVFLGGMLAFGVFSTIRQVRAKLGESEESAN